VAAALLLPIVSAFGTAFYLQRTGGEAAAAQAQPQATVTVYPEPSDAVVKLGGAPIAAGVAVPLASNAATTLSVERPGYRPKRIELGGTRDQVLYVTLVPLRNLP
jgi:hypothetical protein